jgi:PhzF family phenazine biosynthesis protein
MPIRITQVDAFTARPFAGNPAAVCLLSAPAPETWMRSVAAEMNLSETAFLVPAEDGYRLRWFTPAAEVDLCGHATLASAHVLWESGCLPAEAQARFHTRSGLLTAHRRGEWIELSFPSTPPAAEAAPPGLAEALGIRPLWTGRSCFDWLVEVESAAALRGTRPDFASLARIDTRGIIVTARSDDSAFDFVSRFFAPAVGIHEDPVTGSAHCALAPFWSQRLGKAEMNAFQASPRGGVLRVRLGEERVLLAGQAVTVMRGELLA